LDAITVWANHHQLSLPLEEQGIVGAPDEVLGRYALARDELRERARKVCAEHQQRAALREGGNELA
jgi:hypothetical protein